MSTPTVRWRLFSDESEPTSRERGMRVYEELRRQGWDADFWDGRETADIIVLQYDMRALDEALDAAKTVVWDCNDMVFSSGYPGNLKPILDGMKRVHAIVAGSPRLGQHLERLHPTVRMIEQAVGPQYWTVKPKKHTGLNVCWFGMHDNIIYFSEVDAALQRLAHERKFTVHFCTSKASGLDHGDGCGKDNVKRVAAKPYPTCFHEWSIDEELAVIAQCDIGIAPLFHTEWCYGKCANKAMNMMAGRLPVVVSDVPSYRAVITDGVSGRLCFGPEDWFVALDALMEHGEERKRMAAAGRVAAKAHSIDIIARQWGDWFEELTR
jgi:glycosyltransferase involved in cell wall biosynthesis